MLPLNWSSSPQSDLVAQAKQYIKHRLVGFGPLLASLTSASQTVVCGLVLHHKLVGAASLQLSFSVVLTFSRSLLVLAVRLGFVPGAWKKYCQSATVEALSSTTLDHDLLASTVLGLASQPHDNEDVLYVWLEMSFSSYNPLVEVLFFISSLASCS